MSLNTMKVFLSFSLALFLCTLISVARAEYNPPNAASPLETTADGVLVKFRTTTSSATQKKILKSAGCQQAATFSIVPGLNFAHVTSGASVDKTILLLRANPNVEFVEPNYLLTIAAVPNDPQYNALYGLNNTGQSGGVADADIDAPEAWDIQTGTNVIVAVVDTGVNYNHPDLAANIWSNTGEIANNGRDDDGNGFIDDLRGWDFANNDNNPMDDNRHGSHVSGTIAAVGNNGIGVVGVNWRARIMPLKFMSATGRGTTAAAISSINYAVRMGAKVINASWGGGAFSQALFNAISAANNAGILFVAAAGNNARNNDTTPSYPASYNLPNIVSVAATDSSDTLAGFSNFGARTVHLAAPGVAILSTVLNNAYASLSGTSMAAPHVAGVAALALASNPSLSVAALKNALLATVDRKGPLTGVIISGGRLNATNAVANAASTAPPPTVPPPPPPAVVLSVSPQTAIRATGTQQQFTASGGTSPYTWSSSNTGMTISATGTSAALTSTVPGTTFVTVRDANAAVASTGNIEFRTIALTSPSSSVNVGSTLQLNASGGRPPYRWSVSLSNVASINPSTGLLTGVGIGQTMVGATDADNVTGNTTITINAAQPPPPPPPSPSPSISPGTGLLGPGDTLVLTANGGVAPYTWTSSNTAIATIATQTSSTALLTARNAGITTISVRDANNNTSTSGVIEVRTVNVASSAATVTVGGTLQFSASGGRAPYLWSVSNSGLASISTTGTLTALGAGQLTVRAVDADNFFGTSITINIGAAPPPPPPPPPPATTLTVTPSTATINVFGTLQFTATGGTAPYRWTTSNADAVIIDVTGFLTGLSVGSAIITATDSVGNTGTSGTITVNVAPPPPPPPAPVPPPPPPPMGGHR